MLSFRSPTPPPWSRPPIVADEDLHDEATLPPEVRPETGPTKDLPAQFCRTLIDYYTKEPRGTIVIDTLNTHLYLVLGNDKALRYGIGVGREGFAWSGIERISRLAEWPDWNPPEQMIERQPYLPRFMAGGEGNRRHALPHSWYEPAIDHRHVRVLWLHPAHE